MAALELAIANVVAGAPELRNATTRWEIRGGKRMDRDRLMDDLLLTYIDVQEVAEHFNGIRKGYSPWASPASGRAWIE